MGMKCLSLTFIMLQYTMYCSCSARFAETPSSVTIEIEIGVEREAVFRCRHQRIEAVISWQINGSSSRLYTDVVDAFFRDSNNTRVDTLTIPAIPEYNRAKVVCRATLDGSPIEVTPSASLIIKASVSTPTAPTTEPVTVLTSTAPPTEPGFIITPSSLNKTIEQQVAIFNCQHRSANQILWEMNGAYNINSSNITTHPSGDGGFMSSLTLGVLIEMNNTIIKCVAVFLTGSTAVLQSTEPATLLIQGIPGNISNADCKRNYSSGVLTTFWDTLPSLDITGADPGIIYHIELFNITCGQNVPMNNENVTESNISHHLDLMQVYKAIITPRNNVPNFIEGHSVVKQESFMSLNRTTLFELTRNVQIDITDDRPVPLYYVMILESLDSVGDDLMVNITVQREGEVIIMGMEEQLPPKSLWSASISAYGCEINVEINELSTHDIQNIVIESLLTGQISLTGDLVDRSSATGVFVIVYSLTDSSDVRYIAKQTEHTISINISGLTGPEYGVSIFALEDGLPFPQVVTSPKNITISNQEGVSQQPVPIAYELQPKGTVVCITCTFMDDTLRPTECLVVVHQQISQLSSNGLTHIKSSYKFNRSGDTAYGCIEGVNLKQYQIGVIEGRRNTQTPVDEDSVSTFCVGCFVGAMCAATMMILVGIVLSVLIYVTCIKGHTSDANLSVNVEMQRCGAYEIVQLSRQRVTMKDNPAYVDIHLHHHRHS